MSDTPPPPPPGTPPPPPGTPWSPMGGSGVGGPLTGPAGRAIPSPWKRIGARFLDSVIVNLIIGFVIIRLVAGDGAGAVAAADEVDSGKLLLAQLIVLAISFLWDAVATKTIGGTPMKRAFHMLVVQSETGAPVEWKHAIVRWGTLAIWSIIPILSYFVPLIILIVSLVFLFTKPLRRTVWDQTAHTLVVDG